MIVELAHLGTSVAVLTYPAADAQSRVAAIEGQSSRGCHDEEGCWGRVSKDCEASSRSSLGARYQ